MILAAANLTKVFNKRVVFRGLSFEVRSGHILSITGPNGSGKSTASKIICGLLSPTSGEVSLKNNGAPIDRDDLQNHIGFVAPYLEFYGEFTATENLKIEMRARGQKPDSGKIDEVLELVGLSNRRNDELRGFSSGMKQRLKYAGAIVHEPDMLVLDEPTANLDSAGIEMVLSVIQRYRKDRIVVIATNDEKEASLGDTRIVLDRSLGMKNGK